MIIGSPRTVLLVILTLLVTASTGCMSTFVRKKAVSPESIPATPLPPITSLPEIADSTAVEETDSVIMYVEEEELLTRILRYYDEALSALDDGDYGLAETKIDSAAVLSAKVNIENIVNESLSLRYTSTLASLFQEYGRIFNDVDKINQEEPLKWLEELSETDPESFKNGLWKDDELRKIVQKIALRCDVPIDYNEQVKKAIYFFQTRKRDEMAKWMRRSGRYVKLIQDILEEEDLPLDIAYLAMIESGFSSKAYSRARASGLWQFIYSTGRLYGLKRTQWLDERRDPVKSTKAAVQHLEDLYKIYNDWRLVMAAYNSGPTRVTRQYRAGNDDFWTMQLPRETRNYVPSFMAAVVISKAPELFGFEDIEYEDPMEFNIVKVPYTSLSVAAKCAGVDLTEVKELNTELLKNYTPSGTTYSLRIPKGTKERFLKEYDKLPKEKYVPPRLDTYVVKPGDTLSEIADRFRVSVNSLMTTNNIRNPRTLRAGQRLKIPGRTTRSGSSVVAKRVTSEEVAKAKQNTSTYRVQKNDSLWLIANRNNTSISMLQALNNMGNSTRIVPGQTLLIPDRTASASSKTSAPQTSVAAVTDTKKAPGQITYIIKNNDTLYEIGKKYNVSHKDIMDWNKIKDHRKIKAGDKIIIKTN